MASDLGLATEVSLDGLLASVILDGDELEIPHHAQGLTTEHMDERIAGRAADEGVDHVGISDVGDLIALLGEALDVLLEGLIGHLPTVVELPRVPGMSVRALEVTNKDRVDVTLVADAIGLELLEPNSSRA